MNKFIDKIKQKWDENPLEVILVSTIVVSTAMVVVNSMSAARSRNAYARSVDYRIRNN